MAANSTGNRPPTHLVRQSRRGAAGTRRLLLSMAGGWVAMNAACHAAPAAPRPPTRRPEAGTRPPASKKHEAGPGVYSIRGEVVALALRQRQVTLRHEEVPGLMPAMTMPFRIGPAASLPRLGPGDRIEARLRVTGSDSWLEALRVTAPAAAARSAAEPAAYRPTRRGEAVPAVGLRNQDGQPVTVGGPGDRPQVITFIYTRCPLPDYCPRMIQRFAKLQAGLREAGLQGRVRLYSVTLDPQYDTPRILRAHARRAGADLRHWQFITGAPKDVARLAAALGEVYAPDRGLINHNLVTAVIDRSGRLRRTLPGNEWPAAELLAATREAIAERSRGK
jgi:protein SCO1